MKLTHWLKQATAWMALSGMCVPGTFLYGNEPVATPKADVPVRTLIHDIELGQGGLLIGQIFDESMQPKSGATVTIQVDGIHSATTTTDANGVFAVGGLRGGVHQVVVDNSVETCRFWAPGTAPPNASKALRFAPGQNDIVRGQWGPPPTYHKMKSWATNPWVIAGVVGTAIAVPIILHNLDDDDSGS